MVGYLVNIHFLFTDAGVGGWLSGNWEIKIEDTNIDIELTSVIPAFSVAKATLFLVVLFLSDILLFNLS